MAAMNCWEVLKCGRQPGGVNAAEMGVCPAATEKRLNGVHGGKNAGRTCWAVAGTLCHGKVQGAFASKVATCTECNFYAMVRKDEGPGMVRAVKLLEMIS